MTAEHTVIATPIWTPWGIIWRARSDRHGAGTYGDGKTETEAREDLAWRIQEWDE